MMKHSSHQFGDYFSDLVAKVKNLVALAPVLGAISRPARPIQIKTTIRKQQG